MSHIRSIITVAIIVLSLLSYTNLALSDDAFTTTPKSNHLLKRGVYVGIEAGYIKHLNTNAYFNSQVANAFGFNLNLLNARYFTGYRINDNFAIETGYSNYVSMDGNSATPIQLQSSWHYKVRGIDTVLIINKPFQNKLNMFAKMGFAVMSADVSDKYLYSQEPDFSKKEIRAVGVVGTGLDYLLTKNLSLGGSITYQNANGLVPASMLVAARLTYVV